jgi:hypothetical protein
VLAPHNRNQRFSNAATCAALGLMFLAALIPQLSSAFVQEAPQPPEKKIKNRPMAWRPPDVDARVSKLAANVPCDVAAVLKMTGERMKEQAENLPNFTADERIQYQRVESNQADATAPGLEYNSLQDAGVGTFEYLAVISNQGGTSIHETRTPEKGTQPFPGSTQDTGLPAMDFIFLPKFQGDYEMKCEGQAKWDGQDAWVVHFQQRPDHVGHTLTYLGRDGVYSAKLKGRAWIAPETGEVVHLEIAMMEPIPQVHFLNWWLSLDYAPVQFHTQNVRIWLPQTVDAYARYDGYRTMIYHTFANFMLFSVQTQQKIEKPADKPKQN